MGFGTLADVLCKTDERIEFVLSQCNIKACHDGGFGLVKVEHELRIGLRLGPYKALNDFRSGMAPPDRPDPALIEVCGQTA